MELLKKAGALEKELISTAHALPVDFARMQQLVDLGADVNALMGTDMENVFSECIEGFGYDEEDGSGLPELCRFFLRNGFDVHGHNDTAGTVCLEALCFSSYDRYILDAAKILLDAGANPARREYANMIPGNEIDPIQCAISKAAFYELDDDEEIRTAGRLMDVYCSLLEAALAGRDYHAIELI